MIGDVAPGHVIFDRQRIDFPPHHRMGQQSLQFARKRQCAAGQMGEVERLYAEPVARKEQLPFLQVVQREGEHPVEPRKAIGTPFLPRGEDRFRVAIGPELRPTLLQFASQGAVIVDLAVEDDHRPPVGRSHGLGRAGKIDDREPPVTEPDTGRSPDPRSVRPAVGQRVGHRLDPLGIDRLDRLVMEKPRNPAHGGVP